MTLLEESLVTSLVTSLVRVVEEVRLLRWGGVGAMGLHGGVAPFEHGLRMFP